jgi:hypothetical protein
MILGGVAGVAVLAGGAFLLLKGGGSSDSTGGVVPNAHHVVAAPAPVTSPEPTVAVFHGAVGHDPFAPPARIVAAVAPPPPAQPSTAASSVPLSGGGSIVVPTGQTPAGTAPVVHAPAIQWLQLLGAHNVGGHWLVDVRTANGVFKDVKAGATRVGGTYFSYLGEDGSLSKPSFVFVVGDSAGGNLVPNRNVKPFTGTISSSQVNSTLVLRYGRVDGGAS